MITLGAGLQAEPLAPLPSGVFTDLGSSDVLAVVEQMESVKAWADYVSLAATGELARREAQAALAQAAPEASGALEASASERQEVVAAARAATVDELVLATGMSVLEGRRRVDFATGDPARVAGLGARLCAGVVSWQRVRILYEDCLHVPAARARRIAEAVLAPVRSGAALSGGLFRRRLCRELAAASDPTQARDRAVARRFLGVELFPDGTGQLTLTGGAVRMRGAYERIDAMARRLRATGSTRTLAQLRADITLDLILFGHLHPAAADKCQGASSNTTAAATTTAAAAAGPGAAFGASAAASAAAGSAFAGAASSPTSSPADPARPAGPQAPADPGRADGFDPIDPVDPDALQLSFQGWRFGERLPVAQVMITISAASLLGIDDEPGLVAGGTAGDYLHAVLIRDAAYAAGSTWWRLITDPKDGSLQDLSSKGYRPSPALARAVQARDGVCRAPGCCVPAAKCDLDHDTPWPAGATSYANLSAKHRRHHNHKTRRRWHTHRDGDTITWTTGTGRTYTSYPFDYRTPSQALRNQTSDQTGHDTCPGATSPNWTSPAGLWPPIRSWLGQPPPSPTRPRPEQTSTATPGPHDARLHHLGLPAEEVHPLQKHLIDFAYPTNRHIQLSSPGHCLGLPADTNFHPPAPPPDNPPRDTGSTGQNSASQEGDAQNHATPTPWFDPSLDDNALTEQHPHPDDPPEPRDPGPPPF